MCLAYPAGNRPRTDAVLFMTDLIEEVGRPESGRFHNLCVKSQAADVQLHYCIGWVHLV